MTEKELQLLGFEKQEDGGIEISDDENAFWIEDEFYYYTYTVAQGFQFISNVNTDVDEDGQWYVEFFDSYPSIRFIEFGEVQALINLLESRIVNSK